MVKAWGRVEVHAGGFRAEYARPRALALIGHDPASDYGRHLAALAGLYRCELLVLDSPEALVKHCRREGLGLPASVVSELLPKPRPEPPPRPKAIATLAGGSTEPSRWRRRWELTLDVAGFAFIALFWLAVAALVAIAGYHVVWSDMPVGKATVWKPPPPEAPVEVLDQQVIDRDGSWLFLARVRNKSASRAAVGVHPTGLLTDADGETLVDLSLERANPVDIAPGGKAVVAVQIYDEDVVATPASELVPARIKFVAKKLVRSADPPPYTVGEVAFDHRRCLLTAPIWSPRKRLEGRVAIIVYRRERALALFRVIVGPLARGVSEQVLYRVPPAGCSQRGIRLEAAPDLLRGELSG